MTKDEYAAKLCLVVFYFHKYVDIGNIKQFILTYIHQVSIATYFH